jgi:acetyltransferase-like isoleucine patch superfamily enzyme
MRLAAQARQWVKRREHPLARALYALATGARTASLPCVRAIHGPLYAADRAARGALGASLRALWTTPLFQARLEAPAARLYLYGGMPYVSGPVRISLGPDCRMSGAVTISGRSGASEPELRVGANCDIGWRTTIAVGRKVVIGHKVRIAGCAFLAGYPGHPTNARDRAAGLPDTEDQIGDIVIEDDCWLATGVTVLAGVRIGRGAIIGAGSVVTKDVPPFTLAAGAPARHIKSLP